MDESAEKIVAAGGRVDGDPEFWRGVLETNVLALAVGCQAVIKAMRTTRSV